MMTPSTATRLLAPSHTLRTIVSLHLNVHKGPQRLAQLVFACEQVLLGLQLWNDTTALAR